MSYLKEQMIKTENAEKQKAANPQKHSWQCLVKVPQQGVQNESFS